MKVPLNINGVPLSFKCDVCGLSREVCFLSLIIYTVQAKQDKKKPTVCNIVYCNDHDECILVAKSLTGF